MTKLKFTYIDKEGLLHERYIDSEDWNFLEEFRKAKVGDKGTVHDNGKKPNGIHIEEECGPFKFEPNIRTLAEKSYYKMPTKEEFEKAVMKLHQLNKDRIASSLGYTKDLRNESLYHSESDYGTVIIIEDDYTVKHYIIGADSYTE